MLWASVSNATCPMVMDASPACAADTSGYVAATLGLNLRVDTATSKSGCSSENCKVHCPSSCCICRIRLSTCRTKLRCSVRWKQKPPGASRELSCSSSSRKPGTYTHPLRTCARHVLSSPRWWIVTIRRRSASIPRDDVVLSCDIIRRSSACLARSSSRRRRVRTSRRALRGTQRKYISPAGPTRHSGHRMSLDRKCRASIEMWKLCPHDSFAAV